MEDTQDVQASEAPANDDSQDSQEEPHDAGVRTILIMHTPCLKN